MEIDDAGSTIRGEGGVGSTGGVSCEIEKACFAWIARDDHSITSLENGVENPLVQDNAEVLYDIVVQTLN